MTVNISKPAVNLREELANLKKPSGIVGESILRADTAADAVEQLNLEEHTFENFTSTGIDDNATSTKLTVSDSGADVTGTVTASVSDSGATRAGGVDVAAFLESSGNAATQISSGAGFSSYLFMGDANDIDATRIASQNGFTQISASGASDYMRFDAGGFAERMRIDASGNLLVGGTSASVSSYGAKFIKSSTASTILAVHRQAQDGNVAEFGRGGNSVGSIFVTGTSTSYNTSSDYRLKENVVDLTGASSRLQQIPVHRFNFITDPNTTVDGFLAHEAQAVVPEAVTGEKDAVDADGNPDYQGIDQSKLVPLLTAALQEALTEIDNLKARVTALETA